MKTGTTLFLLAVLMNTLQSFGEESAPLMDPARQWNSLLPVDRLELLPKETRQRRIGVIENSKTWRRLWTAWRPDTDVPVVNFQSEVVVFVKNVRYLNRIHVSAVSQAGDEANLTIRETRSARPIRDKLNCVMFVINSKSIQAISDGSTRVSLTPHHQ